MEARVSSSSLIAEGIRMFELVAASGDDLPPFSAGSHIDVVLAEDLSRQYSLCNSPRERHRYVIAVLRDPESRGGSLAMHKLEVGKIVTISEPKNHFPMFEGAEHTVLIAGGIGITPILSMARELALSNASFELHYCARDKTRMAFVDELSDDGFVRAAHLYFDTDGQDAKIKLDAVLASPTNEKHLYVCGPSGFIAAVLKAAEGQGWNEKNVHREYFGLTQPIGMQSLPFLVKLARTGREVEVGCDETIVHALARIGVAVPVSCEQGVCGTCLTKVVAGIPDHRDAYLMDNEKSENNQILPCCSRSKSQTLVLEL